jgi:hypothetical protein
MKTDVTQTNYMTLYLYNLSLIAAIICVKCIDLCMNNLRTPLNEINT